MLEKHKSIQELIKRKYSDKFIVKCESIDGKNYLPDKKSHVYQPDIIVKSKTSGDIVYIIEIEGDPVRKALVGASVLADYSIGKMNIKTKPVLIFIIYTEKGIKQIHNFKEKIKINRYYCKKLRDIIILTEDEFKSYRLK